MKLLHRFINNQICRETFFLGLFKKKKITTNTRDVLIPVLVSIPGLILLSNTLCTDPVTQYSVVLQFSVSVSSWYFIDVASALNNTDVSAQSNALVDRRGVYTNMLHILSSGGEKALLTFCPFNYRESLKTFIFSF